MLDKVIDKAGGVLTEAYGDVVKPVLKAYRRSPGVSS